MSYIFSSGGGGGGSGDVVGPASSTDNAVALFDSTTGKLLQNSPVIVDPSTGDTTGQRDITASRNILAEDELRSGVAGTTAGQLTLYSGDDALGVVTLTAGTTGSTTSNWTLPVAGIGEGTVVGTGVAQTLTNKTLTSPTLNTPVLGTTITEDPTPGTDLTATGTIVSKTVDANATGIGAALVLSSDGNYDEADASASGTMPCSAVALETGTGTKTVLKQGYIRNDAWNWTIGGAIYVSETTGAFTQTAPSTSGSFVQVVGIAETADIIYFNPSFTLVEVA